jgi:transposase
LEKSLDRPVAELPQRLYAYAGYDADWIHAAVQESWGVETLIKPASHRRDGSLGGTYRSKMTPAHLKKRSYGRRWHIESFFSGLKRVTGSALGSRLEGNLFKEAAFRLLAYTLHR